MLEAVGPPAHDPGEWRRCMAATRTEWVDCPKCTHPAKLTWTRTAHPGGPDTEDVTYMACSRGCYIEDLHGAFPTRQFEG